jgi:hypothetical protein
VRHFSFLLTLSAAALVVAAARDARAGDPPPVQWQPPPPLQQQADAPAEPPPEPAPAPGPAAAPPASAPIVVQPPAPAASVMVSIDAPSDVVLEVQDEHSRWVEVCNAPCNKLLSTAGNYRINGDGVRPSKPFRLQPGQQVKLDVDTTSSAGHVIAIVVTVTGAIGVVPALGVTSIIVAAELFGLILICPIVDAASSTSYAGCLGDIAVYFGQAYALPYVWIPGVAGVVMLAGGGAWLAGTPATGVNQTVTGAPPPAPPAAPGAGALPITRRPEWRTSPDRGLYPVAITSPIVSVRF